MLKENHVRNCPVCKTKTKTKIYLNENYNPNKITTLSYSSRKLPEFMCHQMKHCQKCDLAFVSKPPNSLHLSESYHQSDYDSMDEAIDAALSYYNTLKPYLSNLYLNSSILEIGCGSGDFLTHLQKNGYKDLTGFEPSINAINSSKRSIRVKIINAIFNPKLLPNKKKFDLICCFMTIEHVADPFLLFKNIKKILKQNGKLIIICHDRNSFINKVLGKKSPIVDIEHMQLFSRLSIFNLFKKNGFRNIKIESFSNTYSIYYWFKLLPLPTFIKKFMMPFMKNQFFRKIKLSINVGNIIVIGDRY